MLWDIVFEFYVKNIFGGRINGVTYTATLGDSYYFTQYGWNSLSTSAGLLPFEIKFGPDANQIVSMPLGNYLSLIATIISMVAIVLICCALIKKIYNMCAHIIG